MDTRKRGPEKKAPGAARRKGQSSRSPLPARVLEAVREESRAYFRNARGSHDWDHTERVYELCLRIGRKEKADLEVLKLAALLHDIGREEEDRTNGRVCHARRSADLARPILERLGVPERQRAAVIRCIETHRFRGGVAPDSLEGKILFDADKLDSIGAVGIGRAFLFAGEVGARLHDPNVRVEKTKAYSREDTAYREYLVKLRSVKDRIFTREGRRMARDRHRFMAEYFNRLNREVAGRD
jgi:uncharacterized protein